VAPVAWACSEESAREANTADASGGAAQADAASGDSGGTSSSGSAGTAGSAGSAAGASGSSGTAGRILIPQPDAWTDHGTIFDAGQAGDWDQYLWGGFAGCAVKRGGTTFVYYQGANGYSDAFGTVTYRAIGLATSSDGLTFSKHPANPVLTWFPNNALEEGAVSCGASVTSAGTIWLYFGANEMISSSLVNADGRYATSSTGSAFDEQGVVLDHAKSSVWGSGDELFPVIAFASGGNHYAYYIPNGSQQKGNLGVAWGPGPTELTTTAGATSSGNPVQAWGMGSAAELEPGYYGLFVSDVQAKTITAYEVDLAQPDVLLGPVATYSFENMSQGTLLLDAPGATWYLYYRTVDANAYGARTAPIKF
jgi:hypothetical protein